MAARIGVTAVAKHRAGGGKIPSRKISATIIDFGTPLLEQLDAEQPLTVVRAAFDIVVTVWNAHVMAMPAWNAPQFLADLEALLHNPAVAPQMLQAYRALIAHRQERFADDPRAVGAWNVAIDANGSVRLHRDARVPPSLSPKRT